MKILSDLHIHTSASLCCNDKEQTIGNITEIVKGMGLKKIGFADHVWISDKYELSHPFFPYGFIEMYDSSMASICDAELFDACSRAAAKSVGIEINLCYFPNDAKDNLFSVETPIRFISIAKEAGCRFTFGSDAHSLKDLKTLERLQHFIDTMGIEARDLHPLANVADA